MMVVVVVVANATPHSYAHSPDAAVIVVVGGGGLVMIVLPRMVPRLPSAILILLQQPLIKATRTRIPVKFETVAVCQRLEVKMMPNQQPMIPVDRILLTLLLDFPVFVCLVLVPLRVTVAPL